MSQLRLAVIGLGNMGLSHLDCLPKVPGVTVSAICEPDPARLAKGVQKLADASVVGSAFADADDLFAEKLADAVLIATPHYDHPTLGIRAFETGHHVLVEKPLAVSVTGARALIAAATRRPDRVFGIMYNQRTNPMYAALRDLIIADELGPITRVSWIVTDWFRTHAYYASGGWRATWKGEGGGVLLNQCPHNLDLLQWITGLMPTRVTAVGALGKTHPIEVEDEMSAILEFTNGAIGHFVTSTGEWPGTNRLEICGDRGRVVAEHGKLAFSRTLKSVREVNETSPNAFASIDTWQIDVPYPKPPAYGEHERIVRNFVDACANGTPLIAPGAEGARGLELGNAMLMSAVRKRSVELPIDGAAYDAMLEELSAAAR